MSEKDLEALAEHREQKCAVLVISSVQRQGHRDMSDQQQLKRLQDEKARCEVDVERTKTIIKTSEAAKDLVQYVVDTQKKDPFVNTGLDQPYTKKPGSGGGGCTIL